MKSKNKKSNASSVAKKTDIISAPMQVWCHLSEMLSDKDSHIEFFVSARLLFHTVCGLVNGVTIRLVDQASGETLDLFTSIDDGGFKLDTSDLEAVVTEIVGRYRFQSLFRPTPHAALSSLVTGLEKECATLEIRMTDYDYRGNLVAKLSTCFDLENTKSLIGDSFNLDIRNSFLDERVFDDTKRRVQMMTRDRQSLSELKEVLKILGLVSVNHTGVCH